MPSIEFILSRSSSALKRFPLTILSAAVATFSAIYLSELNYEQVRNADHWYALIMAAVLGISVFFAIRLMGEKMEWSMTGQLTANLLGTGALALYFFLLPDDFDTAPEAFIFRYILYFLAAHLLVAIGPYWSRGEMSGFWQYNKTLFLRFLTAVLFSAVLYIGLIVALGSVDILFNAEIDSVRYFQLFLLIGGIFNTWFFVSGIPEPIQALSRVQDYPKGLKIFTQNILIPLVTIYVVILYLYTGKILLEWSWPEGWVAYLVLSFSIVGIFALLLLHPIQEKVENRWIKKFSRSYFLMLVPLVILLLLAIWRRIWEYGITVNRYFVLILGIWLAGIVAYFILSKTKNIKVIPASLGIIAFLISFGPWGAFSIPEQSQKDRLESYLLQHGILVEETVQKATVPVPFEDRKEISSIVRYLSKMHGEGSLQSWFEEDLSSLSKQAEDATADSTRPVNRNEMPRFITEELMGVEYVTQWQTTAENVLPNSYSSSNTDGQAIAIDHYDWMINFSYPKLNNEEIDLGIAGDSLAIRTDPNDANVKIYSHLGTGDTLQINLGEMMRKLRIQYDAVSSYNIPPAAMSAEGSNEWLDALLFLENLNISMQEQEGDTVINSLNGRLLLKFKD